MNDNLKMLKVTNLNKYIFEFEFAIISVGCKFLIHPH